MTVLTPPQIAAVASAAGFSGGQLVIAVAVAMAESSGQTDATHHNSDGSTDYGLWQINSVHPDVLAMGDWRDPATNARMAMAVYRRQGWGAWTVYNTQQYAKHLPAAQQAAAAPQTAPAELPIIPGGPLLPPWAAGAGGVLTLPFALPGVSDAGQAIASLTKLLEIPITAVEWLTHPDNWARIAKIAVGAALVLAGLRIVAQPVTAPIVAKTKDVAGKAAKAAAVAAAA